MNFVIDIGGKSTRIALFENQNLLKKEIIYYNKIIDIHELICLIDLYLEKELVNKVNTINKICVSSPGSINHITGKNTGISAVEKINELNLKKHFESKYNIKTLIENDANCAGIAEIKIGAAKNKKNGLIFVLGSGLGGCIFIDHKIINGKNNMSGEFGYQIFDIDRKLNVSQAVGMINLENEYFCETKSKKTGLEIYNLYYVDEVARKIIDSQIKKLSLIIFNSACIFDPDIILIGGSISKNNFFFNQLKELLQENIKKFANNITIELSKCIYEGDANLIGANLLE